jgi:hypothetical protein
MGMDGTLTYGRSLSQQQKERYIDLIDAKKRTSGKVKV